MSIIIQALGLSVIGVILIWFGYTIFFLRSKESRNKAPSPSKGTRTEMERPPVYSGAPQTCPVCSAKLAPGEQVKSSVFPKFPGQDRIMHITGCVYCLQGDRPRVCPVCEASLKVEEFLVARLFEKPGRSHVHILGCSHCR